MVLEDFLSRGVVRGLGNVKSLTCHILYIYIYMKRSSAKHNIYEKVIS
jgi:hypothetical protein